MRNLNYVTNEVRNNLWMSDIQKLRSETPAIEKAKRYFISFAENIDGGIDKDYKNRNTIRYRELKHNFNLLINLIGQENVNHFIVTNIFRIELPVQRMDYIKDLKKELLKEYNIVKSDDLDLRYCIDGRDYFIFWESILFIMNDLRTA